MLAVSLIYINVSKINGIYKNKDQKVLLFIFIIYTLYCLYDIYINPQVERSELRGVKPDIAIFLESIYILMFINASDKIAGLVDNILIAKVYVIINTVITPLYLKDTFIYYQYSAMELISFDEFTELGLISPLGLGVFSGMAVLLAVYIRNMWFNSKIYNHIVLIIIILVNCVTFIVIAKRGAVLFLLCGLFFYYYTKLKNKRKILQYIILFAVLLICVGTTIVELLNKMNV